MAQTAIAVALQPAGEVPCTATARTVTEVRSNDGTTVRVGAHEDADGFAGSWSLNAYGICAS
ncbi:hypothetical protein BSA16_05995 [Micromonospora sp. Rc5]|nr:hypothetical protein BSA16_05995 [Micromonospora sp. Rc5]